MAQGKTGPARSDAGPDRHGATRPPGGDSDTVGRPVLLPADLARALRRLDDAELDRLLEAAGAEARRRGRRDARTAGAKPRRTRPAVTPGQERLILAASGAGLKPAAIAREFRLSRAQVEGVLAAAKRRR